MTSYASRYPYETWVVPRRHAGDFRDCTTEEIEDLAVMFRKVLAALESVLGSFPFNLMLRSSPIGGEFSGRPGFHWRFEILPRAVAPSGLELGWDVFVVSTSPEEAAERLRAAVR
jgi:UDPglucose--hexose-1-phosphate uridylyltransferase